MLSWNQEWGSGSQSHWSGWLPPFLGASTEKPTGQDFPKGLVTVPLHIEDHVNHPPVEDDGLLVSGVLGFTVEEREVGPVVEPRQIWSLFLPRESPVKERLL